MQEREAGTIGLVGSIVHWHWYVLKRPSRCGIQLTIPSKGISFAYWLDFGMSYAGGAIAWRLPIAVQLIFAICVIILLFGLPESPR